MPHCSFIQLVSLFRGGTSRQFTVLEQTDEKDKAILDAEDGYLHRANH